MRGSLLLGGAVGAVMLLHGGAARAQSGVEITAEQELAVYIALAKTKVAKPPPASFQASVGMAVPADVELYEIPSDIKPESVRRYRYTLLNDDEVVFVDPATRKVVLVLRQPH